MLPGGETDVVYDGFPPVPEADIPEHDIEATARFAPLLSGLFRLFQNLLDSFGPGEGAARQRRVFGESVQGTVKPEGENQKHG